MTPRAVEQIFLERKGGVVEVLLVLEDEAGGRVRERLPLSVDGLEAAVSRLARHLLHRGIVPAARVRLRVASGSGLRDDSALLERLLELLEAG